MKKKFKLFATIGSLALAICMMTIGVLAASTVTLDVNSTVSFNVSSVFSTITGVADGTGAAAKFTVKTYSGEGTSMTPVATIAAQDLGNMNFTDDDTQIVYTFTISNDAPAGTGNTSVQYSVALAGETTTALESATQLSGEFSDNASGKIAQGAKAVTVTYTLTLSDVTKSFAAVNISFDISVSAVAA